MIAPRSNEKGSIMAKPEPVPELKGKEARELMKRLRNPTASKATREFYRGAAAEYRKSVRR